MPQKPPEVWGKERTSAATKTTELVQNSVHSWRVWFAESCCMHLGDKEGPGQVPCSMIETKEAFVAAQSTELPISRDSNSEDSENVFEGVGKNMNENDQ